MRDDLRIKPSQEYLKAFDIIEKLGGTAKIPDRDEILKQIQIEPPDESNHK